MVAHSSKQHAVKLAKIKANQHAADGKLHQIIAQLNRVTFYANDPGRGCIYYGRLLQGRTRGPGRGPSMYVMGSLPKGDGFPLSGGFPPNSHPPGLVPPGPTHGGFQGSPASGPWAFHAPPTMPAQDLPCQ
jgi:hypothetical protein